MQNKKTIYALAQDDYTGARICWILQRHYNFESFSDSESLLSAMRNQKPDLVILDTSSNTFEVEAIIERTKGVCSSCVSYLLLSSSCRNNRGSLFSCNCIVGQVHLPLIPDQLTMAVKHGLELSSMCKIRSNLFSLPLPADPIDLVMLA